MSSQAVRIVNLLIGTIAVAAAAVSDTGNWWLTATFGIVAGGALWQLLKPSRRLATSPPYPVAASIAIPILAVVGAAACLGMLPAPLMYAGALSFAVAYIEYLIAYSRRATGQEGGRASADARKVDTSPD